MRFGNRHFHFSIFVKLVLVFLLIFIPFFVLTMLMNRGGEKIVTNGISTSMVAQVYFYYNSLETELMRITKQQQELANDANLTKLSVAGNLIPAYEKVDLISILLTQMNNIQNSSIYIRDINVYMPIIHSTLSTTTSISELEESEFISFYDAVQLADSSIVFWQDRLFLTFFYPNPPLPNKNHPTFLLSIELSIGNLRGMLQNFAVQGEGGAALIHKDWVIASEADESKLNILNQAVEQQAGLKPIKIHNQEFIAAREQSDHFNYSLLVYLPSELLLKPVLQYRIWFWMLFGISACIIPLFAYGIFRLIHRPLLQLVRAFRKIEAGDLEVIAIPSRKDEFRYLYDQFNAMVNRLKLSIQQVYETKINAQRSELKQLQSQINPHFLYNCFFILNEMVQHHEDDDLKKFTKNLGNYFQFITRSYNDLISLEMEVRHALSYIEIQSIRFAQRIQVYFDPLPEAYRHIQVPRMILQPMIENAYHHGLKDTLKDGHLAIRFVVSHSDLTIVIEDNGQRLTTDKLTHLQQQLSDGLETAEITGMINVHRRLRLLFGADSGISLSVGPSGGLLAALHIHTEEATP